MNSPRRVGLFSCGAASAIACKIADPDIITYSDTGSEHPDNMRFLHDCEEKLFHKKVTILKSKKYEDTWDIWEKKKFIGGFQGAPCTSELKIKPREDFHQEGDIYIWGYTFDKSDQKRAFRMEDRWPELEHEFPLIDNGITKAGCLALLEEYGILEPITYAMGFQNANCLPCAKASSAAYFALVRQEFPKIFDRYAKLCRQLKFRPVWLKNDFVYPDEVPSGHPTTDPVVPACDMYCQATWRDQKDAWQAEQRKPS